MKYENYLVLLTNGSYVLARGYKFDDPKYGLAYCHFVDYKGSRFPYMIIDINSGLCVIKGTSKKKLMDTWYNRTHTMDIYYKIMVSKTTDYYLKCVIDLNAEKKLWRKSGYLIEGR